MNRLRLNGSLVALVLALAACGGESAVPDSPAPTVGRAVPVRGGLTLEREGHEENILGPARVELGATLSTAAGARAALEHDGGAWVLFDASSSAAVTLDELNVESGRVFIDARRGAIVVNVTGGQLRAEGATFAVDASATPEIYVGNGEVTWLATTEGDDPPSGHLAQGEVLVFDDSPEPSAADLWDDWTGGLADPAPWRLPAASYIGVLAGRMSGEIGKARRPVSVRAHEVDAVIRGDLAITTITQTFFNAESASLDAHYRMRVPEGAIVSGFEVDMGGGFVMAQPGSMGWSTSGLSWGMPSNEQRLAYDGQDRIHARVTPIAPGASVRIRVRYTHWLKREGSRRTYVYPMVDEGAEPPLVGEFRLHVDITGNRVEAMRAGMGAQTTPTGVTLRRGDYRPTSDFYLDMEEIRTEQVDTGAAAYVVNAPPVAGEIPHPDGPERFVHFDIPTASLDLPEPEASTLDLVLVVDVSGATQEEDLELSRAVVESVMRQLAPTDRVAVLLGDVTAHAPDGLDGTFIAATPENAESILEALATVPLGGATDLGRMLRDASVLAAGKARGAVLYLGDGTPTTGRLDASSIRESLATVEDAPRLFALALGEGAGTEMLRRVTEHAEGVTLRTEAARAVMRILADAARPMLRNAFVDFGPTVERVFPRLPRTVALDEPLRFTGRLRGELPEALQVSGTRDGEAFEASISLRSATVEDEGDIRRRWAQARLEELVDEDAGREALVELGQRFALLTPWTSFIVGGYLGQPFQPCLGFDHDPTTPAIIAPVAREGWRRRRPGAAAEIDTIPESTWRTRVDSSAVGEARGDGGLGQESVRRTLENNERGPRACYERRLVVRPDLQGSVNVQVSVDGTGDVKDARVASQSLQAADVVDCIVAEIRGTRFPATGGASVTLSYSYSLTPGSSMGRRRTCSDASRQSLEVRRALWRERLSANTGVPGAVSVWNEASRQCELGSWSSRRALLDQMMRNVGGLQGQVALYQQLRREPSVGTYLRRAILRRVRTPQDVEFVRRRLGLEANVDWTYFSRVWNRTSNPEARLRLVRRWLEVLSDEFDLRLRELALLEELDRIPEARRLAHRLRAHPLADAAVYAAVGEFHLRQGDEREARRVFSELVEGAPYDPWARRRLGDLYRAHGWHDDAYREYTSLSRLTPSESSVLLLLARAAAGAGRIDEALRLQQRLAEQSEPGKFEGVAGVAQLWTLVRLAGLSLDEAAPQDAINERMRSTGLLRTAPSAIALFTWAHPEDAPAMFANIPSTPVGTEWERANVSATALGIEAVLVDERDEGDELKFEIRRSERDSLRDLEGTFWLVTNLGTPEERFVRQSVTLSRETRTQQFRVSGNELTVL